MRRVRACAAIALSIAVTAMLSACSTTEEPLKFPEPPALSQAVPAPRPEPSTPGQVRAAAYRWFTAAGYPAFQAAALVDHAAIGSGFRPCAACAARLAYALRRCRKR